MQSSELDSSTHRVPLPYIQRHSLPERPPLGTSHSTDLGRQIWDAVEVFLGLPWQSLDLRLRDESPHLHHAIPSQVYPPYVSRSWLIFQDVSFHFLILVTFSSGLNIIPAFPPISLHLSTRLHRGAAHHRTPIRPTPITISI